MVLLCHTIAETRETIATQVAAHKSVGFVPTMGALHQGHLELVKRAASENDFVVVSIFVNPIQFNNPDDLKNYPRNLEKDMELLGPAGCNLVFAPSADEMYPAPDHTEFDFGKLDKVMEGRFRPGHFRGVAVVVKKLFEIVTPGKAYFGEKDFQQLAIIRRLVEMYNVPLQVVGCPIVREPDGLAMSSRNARLSPHERTHASAIYEALVTARESFSWFTPAGLENMLTAAIEQDGFFKVEYVAVADTVTLQPFSDWPDVEHAVVCVAAFIGQVRLIDNVILY